MTPDLIEDLSRYMAATFLKQPNRSIRPDEALISSGLIDSFSLVDLALHVEETYGVVIDNTELNADTFDTLQQLAALIQERQA